MSHPRPRAPHRFRFDFNWVGGMGADRWLELLVRERGGFDWGYAHRAAFVTALSVPNLLLNAASALRFPLRADRPVAAPLFVLGHWRQGTTHLHNLLSLDPSFSFPSTYEVLNPRHYLLTRHVLPRLLAPLLPRRRPMDEVALGFELPQEDEYALALESLVSPYLAMVFPRSGDRYARHLTLRDAPRGDVRRWKKAFWRIVQRHGRVDPRPLILKSPTHTARVPLLLELFPEARFVHIRRDPYTVFQSMRRLLAKIGWFENLQFEPSVIGNRDETILSTYAEMYGAWFEDRGRIPAGRLAEIAFEDLERDPVGTLRGVYGNLGLPGFEPLVPSIEAAIRALGGYRKNQYEPLPPADRAKVADRWAQTFEAWGYPR